MRRGRHRESVEARRIAERDERLRRRRRAAEIERELRAGAPLDRAASERRLRLPHDLICPRCFLERPTTREWSVERGVCMSCVRYEKHRVEVDPADFRPVFVDRRYRDLWSVRVGQLIMRRHFLELSRGALAQHLGWAPERYRKLEQWRGDGLPNIRATSGDRLVRKFRELGTLRGRDLGQMIEP